MCHAYINNRIYISLLFHCPLVTLTKREHHIVDVILVEREWIFITPPPSLSLSLFPQETSWMTSDIWEIDQVYVGSSQFSAG